MNDFESLAMAGSVLIIDDEAEIRESLQTLLELEGYEVETAATGQQGLHRIGERAFDLILLDLALARSQRPRYPGGPALARSAACP